MDTASLISHLALWGVVLFVLFLLLGTLRVLGMLYWRLEQVQAVTPGRLNRNGLRRGAKAPDFILPDVAGQPVALSQFAGRPVLLALMRTDCGPCQRVIPELNRLQEQGRLQVVTVTHGSAEEVRRWAERVHARFPVLVQENLDISRRYEVFTTPFGFLLNENGIIRAKGLLRDAQDVQFLFTEARIDGNGG